MIQQTSLNAYEEAKTSSWIKTRKKIIINLLKKHPDGLTAQEIKAKLGFTDPNMVRPRLTELSRDGFVFSYDTRPCSKTGRVCLVWRLV